MEARTRKEAEEQCRRREENERYYALAQRVMLQTFEKTKIALRVGESEDGVNRAVRYLHGQIVEEISRAV